MQISQCYYHWQPTFASERIKWARSLLGDSERHVDAIIADNQISPLAKKMYSLKEKSLVFFRMMTLFDFFLYW